MKKSIKISKEIGLELRRKYSIGHTQLWRALNYIGDSWKLKKIREDAIAMGGIVTDNQIKPNCHIEQNNDNIIQQFAGGVKLVISQLYGTAIIYKGDNAVNVYDKVTMADFGRLLKQAKTISEQILKQ